MRTREDAIRSVRRYVASALGSPPWRVRMAMDKRFRRPFALVSPPPTPEPLGASGPSTVRAALSIVVQLYPELPQPGPERATEARMLAERAAEQLSSALLYGGVDASDASVRGFHGRIPLWDYTDETGMPLPLAGAGSVATRRFAMDYLWLPDGAWSVFVQPEASEDELFVAVANLRVQWFRASALRSTGLQVQSTQIGVQGNA